MSKKFVVLKCGSDRRLYLDDIAKVYTFKNRKTPKVPKYGENIESETESSTRSLNGKYR
jgi:hypothetical protein